MSVTIPTMGDKDMDRLVRAIRELATGRSNATGSFSLAVSPATTTTVTAPNCGAGSFVGLMPTNAAAQAAGAYVSSVSNGSFVVTHSSSASARTFKYAIQG